MNHHGLTVITEVLPDEIRPLKRLLNQIGSDIEDNSLINFERFGTVHYMRWVVLDPAEIDGEWTPPQLVLATNYDGDLGEHLSELVEEGGEGWFRIYAHCKGAPKAGDKKGMLRFLREHLLPISAFYVGVPGPTAREVRSEAQVRKWIQEYLQESNPSQNWAGSSALEIRREIIAHLKTLPQAKWAFEPAEEVFFQKYGRLILGLAAVAILGVLGVLTWLLPWVMGPVFVLLLLVSFAGWLYLRKLEKKDEKEWKPLSKDPEHVGCLIHRENHKVQNQITHLVVMKPSWFRKLLLKMVFGLVGILVKLVFNRGELAGIRTIHFARWVTIDEGRRLLFFSNFDGSWESYLGEFVERGFMGLNAVWSNTREYPPTDNLIYRGARYASAFKAWARTHQIETQVWYSGYFRNSVQNVSNNRAIRSGLLGKMNEAEARAWLQRL